MGQQKSFRRYLEDAEKTVRSISPLDAHLQSANGHGLILDVREAAELEDDGKIERSLHIPRGLLEAKADPEAKGEPQLVRCRDADKTVLKLCASGARAKLAARTLQEMGYQSQDIEGGIEGWKADGLPTT